MEKFIKNIEKGEFQTEFLIDATIFSKEVILKAMYELVDKTYMFIKKKENDFIVQFKLKNSKYDLDEITNSFGEELVFHDLRKQIEEKTGDRREKIIETSLGFSMGNEEIKKTLKDITKKLGIYYNVEDIHILIENLKNTEENIKNLINLMKEKISKKNISNINNKIIQDIKDYTGKLEKINFEGFEGKKYKQELESIKKEYKELITHYKKTNSIKSSKKLEQIYSNIWKLIEKLIININKIEGKEEKTKEKSINDIIGEIKDDDDFTDEDKEEIIAILKDIED